MGCWNKTCGLTGLPIYEGERVYAFIINQNMYHDRCYNKALWEPMLLPFECTYDGYGGGKDSSPELQLILECIKKDMKEMPNGDIEITKDKMDEELLFAAIHKGELKGAFSYIHDTQLDLVMMRKDVVDRLLETYKVEDFWNNTTFSYPEFVADVDSNDVPDVQWFGAYIKTTKAERYSSYIRDSLMYFELTDALPSSEYKMVAKGMIKGFLINRYMSSIRKIWVPACHEGSQQDVTSGYKKFAELLSFGMERIEEFREG